MLRCASMRPSSSSSLLGLLGGRGDGALGRGLRAGLTLLGLGREHPAGRVRESRVVTPAGSVYDLYEPTSEVRRTLVQFARTFAASGFRVATVRLPALAACDIAASDVPVLCDAVGHLTDAHGGRVGVIGFSFGSGVALTAAADAAIRDRVDPLLVFGAPHQLAEVWDNLLAFGACPPASDGPWDDFCYVQLIWALRRPDLVSAAVHARARELLEGYCAEKDIQVKRSFCERELLPLDLASHTRAAPRPAGMRELSPAGRLAEVTARVLLVHDSADRIIPPAHSERSFAELARRGDPDRQRLLISPVVSHVTPGDLWRLGDLRRLLGMFGELFRSP